jgi:hypothetical protein
MTDRALKCIFVCHEAIPQPSGGIGSYTFTMAKALAQLGVDVTVVGLYEQPLYLMLRLAPPRFHFGTENFLGVRFLA